MNLCFTGFLVFCFVQISLQHGQSDSLRLQCRPCSCTVPSPGEITVDCSHKNLHYLPASIPKKVTSLLLNSNNFSQLEHHSFSKFPRMRRLDLSRNKLKKLHVKVFRGAYNLEILSLQHNQLQLHQTVYPPGLFRHQRKLRILKINRNTANNDNEAYPDSTINDLTSLEELYVDGLFNATFGKGFKRLQNLSTLVLSGHTGTCNIIYLSKPAFQFLPYLRYLDLTFCKLHQIDRLAFRPLTIIDTLDISDNPKLGFDGMAPALFGLRYSQIRVLKANKINPTFAIGIHISLDHVRCLNDTKVKEIHLDNNRIELVDEHAMSVFPFMEVLYCRNNRFTFGKYLLMMNSFVSLRRVEASLQYTSNPLPLSQFESDGPPSLNMARVDFGHSVEHMSVNSVPERRPVYHVKQADLDALPYTDVQSEDKITPEVKDTKHQDKDAVEKKNKWIDLSTGTIKSSGFVSQQQGGQIRDGNISQFQNYTVNPKTPGQFEHQRSRPLDVKSSEIETLCMDTNTGFNPFPDSDKLKQLKNIFAAANTVQRKDSLLASLQIPFSKNLEHVNLASSKLSYHIPKISFGPNIIKYVNLTQNFLNRWVGPLTGVDNLENVDLSNNFCDNVSSYFFYNFTSLKFLNISRNYLSMSLAQDSEGEIFKMQTKLQVLRLSDNKIRELPRKIFRGLKNLEVLDLGENFLSSWSVDIHHMGRLRFLDLANNRFQELPRNLRKDLDSLAKNISLRLEGNILQCSCDTLEFLEWMLHTKVTVQNIRKNNCHFPDGSIRSLADLEDIVLSLKKQCTSYVQFVIGAVVGVLFFVALVILVILYRYRWKLRYLYYASRSKYRGYTNIGDSEEQDFIFDAFISYADEDRSFVVNDMKTKLKGEKSLRLCIHHRDFLVGEAIAANIINAVRKSRKTVIVLSSNFLKSSWCNYEVHMANMESVHTGRNTLIVIFYENIPTEKLTNEILEIIKNDTFIEYTEDPQNRAVFWDHLIAAIRTR